MQRAVKLMGVWHDGMRYSRAARDVRNHTRLVLSAGRDSFAGAQCVGMLRRGVPALQRHLKDTEATYVNAYAHMLCIYRPVLCDGTGS